MRSRVRSHIGRLRQYLKLREAFASLAVARSVAVAAGVAAADDDHIFALGRNLIKNCVALIELILLCEEFHRKMDALQFAAGNREIAGCVARR